jgi:hypothetical protein
MVKHPEPCVSCGEDTSAGSSFYSDRLVDRTGDEPRFLCSLCAERQRGSREIHDDTERVEAQKRLEKGAFAFGAFLPGGH